MLLRFAFQGCALLALTAALLNGAEPRTKPKPERTARALQRIRLASGDAGGTASAAGNESTGKTQLSQARTSPSGTELKGAPSKRGQPGSGISPAAPYTEEAPSRPPNLRSSSPADGMNLDVPLDVPEAGMQIYTLEEFISIAESTNPRLADAAAGISSADGDALQAGLYPNPRLDVFSPQLAGSESQYSAQIAQEIVVKGKLQLQRDAALRGVQQARLTYVRTQFELLTDVRKAFYIVLAGQRRVAILEELVIVLQKSRDTADRLLTAGEGTKTDVLLLDIELQNASVQLQNSEALLDAARRQLAASVGAVDLPVGVVKGDLAAKTPNYNAIAFSQGVSGNSQLLSASVQLERSQIQLRREIVEPYPNVTVTGGGQYQVTYPHKQGVFQISVPLPFWNRNQGGIAAAHANVARANASYLVTQNSLSKSLAGAVGRYRAAQQLVDRYEQKILPQAAEARDIVQRGYALGELDFLRLLQSQKTLVESNLGYIKAQEERWDAAADIANILQLEAFPGTSE